MNIPSNSEIDDLYAKFCERKEEIDEPTAFFEAVKSLFPDIEGAEDDSKTWVRYSPKLVDEICRRIAVGEPIRWILRAQDKPNWNTLRRWMDKYPDFGEKYAMAMQHRADYIAHKMVELASECQKDPKNANGYKVAASILQWQAAMGNPKKYSERMINIEEHEAPKSMADVMAETARLCKELNVDMNLLIQHKEPT